MRIDYSDGTHEVALCPLLPGLKHMAVCQHGAGAQEEVAERLKVTTIGVLLAYGRTPTPPTSITSPDPGDGQTMKYDENGNLVRDHHGFEGGDQHLRQGEPHPVRYRRIRDTATSMTASTTSPP